MKSWGKIFVGVGLALVMMVSVLSVGAMAEETATSPAAGEPGIETGVVQEGGETEPDDWSGSSSEAATGSSSLPTDEAGSAPEPAPSMEERPEETPAAAMGGEDAVQPPAEEPNDIVVPGDAVVYKVTNPATTAAEITAAINAATAQDKAIIVEFDYAALGGSLTLTGPLTPTALAASGGSSLTVKFTTTDPGAATPFVLNEGVVIGYATYSAAGQLPVNLVWEGIKLDGANSNPTYSMYGGNWYKLYVRTTGALSVEGLWIENHNQNANAKSSNAVTINNVSQGSLKNCRFVNNIMRAYTGGEYMDGTLRYSASDTFDMYNCVFEGNTAENGGAIYANGVDCKTDITKCRFISNTADISSRGATASSKGGAIFIAPVSLPGGPGGSAVFTVNDCDFEENKATYGGAIDINLMSEEASVIVQNSRFKGNKAEDLRTAVWSAHGGAISNEAGQAAGTILIEGCDFTNNSAKTDGGALYFHGSLIRSLQVKDCTMTGNYTTNPATDPVAPGRGGAVYLILMPSSVSFENCSISEGSAVQGGAVYLYYVDEVNMTGCYFMSTEQTSLLGIATRLWKNLI